MTWEGPEDPKNPRNWSKRRKWGATLVVSSFTFISPVASTMVAPALASIASDFDITNKVESQMVLSIFVLAYAVGPLFLVCMPRPLSNALWLPAMHVALEPAMT